MAGASLVFILLSGNLPFLAGLLPGLLMAALMMLTVTYFAHKNKWGADIKFSGSRLAKALAELAVVAAWPLLLWGLIRVGAPPHITVIAGLVAPFALDKIFKFEAVLPITTPVLLIGGMTTGLFTPTEGAIAACVWAMVLGFGWYRTRSGWHRDRWPDLAENGGGGPKAGCHFGGLKSWAPQSRCQTLLN